MLKLFLKIFYLYYTATKKCLFPKIIRENNGSIEKCSRRCDIFRNVLLVSTKFTCYATKRKYKIRGTLTCNTKNNLFDNL